MFFFEIHGDSGVHYCINSHKIVLKYITNGSEKHSLGLYKQINRVKELLTWDLAICLNYLKFILDFKF